MKTVPKVLVMFAGLSFALAGQAAETLTIATVNNADMIRMQKLSKTFESEHPDIKLELGGTRRECPAPAPDH